MGSYKALPIDLDGYLFDNGLTLESYFIRVASFSEVICYRNSEGKEFYLTVNDDGFEMSLKSRLIELGVETIKVG